MLYLIRHGSVEGNGTADPPLSAAGRESAAKGAELIRADGGTVDIVLCSPLRRAMDHAGILGDLTGKEVRVMESLEPEGDFSELLDEMQGRRHGGVAVVGHLPQLRRITFVLISAARSIGIHYDNGGIASVEVSVVGGELKGELRWLAGTGVLDMFAARYVGSVQE